MLYYRCVECLTEIDGNYECPDVCPECECEDIEEVYTLKCEDCGAEFEDSLDSPCIECEGENVEECY